MNKSKKILLVSLSALLALFILLLIYRALSSRHLDDLHPDIPCEEKLIKKSDYLAVIPLYNNKSIAKDKKWCDYIKSFNKTLILHGVYHTFNEFNDKRDYEYVETGIKEFEKCFGYKPSEFKPPQVSISEKNKALLEKSGFKVYTRLNQITHKVYHCSDDGMFPNWLINLF